MSLKNYASSSFMRDVPLTGQPNSPDCFWIDADYQLWYFGCALGVQNQFVNTGTLQNTTREFKFTKLQDLSEITQIVCCESFFLFLNIKGQVFVVGKNSYWMLGDATVRLFPTVTQLPELSEIIEISCGVDYFLALDVAGSVWGKGSNRHHRMGDIRESLIISPIKIKGLPACTKIFAALYSASALAVDGKHWIWGDQGSRKKPRKIDLPFIPVDAVECKCVLMFLDDEGSVWQLAGRGKYEKVPLPNAITQIAGWSDIVYLLDDSSQVWGLDRTKSWAPVNFPEPVMEMVASENFLFKAASNTLWCNNRDLGRTSTGSVKNSFLDCIYSLRYYLIALPFPLSQKIATKSANNV